MEFSRRWIGAYVPLEDLDDAVLAARLTAAGLAVEGKRAIDDGAGGSDTVFDVDITTNRPDCMNHLGLARELSVLLDRPLTPPASALATVEERASSAAQVAVDDHAGCPRLVALAIRGVRVGPSPEWLVRRLEAIGHRAINNVVDVTNFVLWESGQPLHAYDLGRLAGARLRVRWAERGETLTTLDGERRALDPEVLVIADRERPVGLAGIMGGLDSEVTADTVDVLLEAGHFDPRTVRRGAKKLGMHTDASHRFERGADPEACLLAARRAAALIAEVADGTVLDGQLDAWQPRPEWPPAVAIEHRRLEAFGGIAVAADEVERILIGLGFQLAPHDAAAGGRAWRVTAPSWRYYDLQDPYPADVYEEVLRVVGFDAVPSSLPRLGTPDAPARREHVLRYAVRDHLAASGFAEAIDYAFLDRRRAESFPSLYGERAPLALANPLSDRYAVMRRSLLPDLVASARYNQRRGAPAVRLFEIGHVFAADQGTAAVDRETPAEEMETVALVAGGTLGTPWERQVALDFFDLKGVVESLASALGVTLTFRAQAWPRLIAGSSAALIDEGGRTVGLLGVLDQNDSATPLLVAEIAMHALLRAAPDLAIQEPPRLPGIDVDSTLTHPLELSWHQLAAAIAGHRVADLVSFRLKDRYQGEGVPAGAVNTTVAFHYQAAERTLTQEEVNARHTALIAALEDYVVSGAEDER